jgi:glycosyltransferase involved in cell wall biosynthesis
LMIVRRPQRPPESYPTIMTRIHCIRHNRNLGPAAAKDTALQAGDAPFVVYVDADDFLHPEFLSATLEAIQREGKDCAYTEFQRVELSNDLLFVPISLLRLIWLSTRAGRSTCLRLAGRLALPA